MACTIWPGTSVIRALGISLLVEAWFGTENQYTMSMYETVFNTHLQAHAYTEDRTHVHPSVFIGVGFV